MELKNIQRIEKATVFGRREMFRIGSSLIFIAGIFEASNAFLAGGDVALINVFGSARAEVGDSPASIFCLCSFLQNIH